jgi:hypothetical protein
MVQSRAMNCLRFASGLTATLGLVAVSAAAPPRALRARFEALLAAHAQRDTLLDPQAARAS